MPRLIVNADDFGLHPAINAAVIAGHERGIVTSCSLIAREGHPAFDEAVRLARGTPRLDVGLHFTLVGLPGLPGGYAGFLAAALAGRFPASRLRALLDRQLGTLERAGIAPSHIDSHQHLHALPWIMDVVARACVERGIPAVRLPRERSGSAPGAPPARRAASRVLAVVADRAEVGAERAGVWRPDAFLGMAVSGRMTGAALLELIERIPPSGDSVTEIVCHPGADNAALESALRWGYDWQGELAAVQSAAARALLTERGIVLTSFREAAAERAAPRPELPEDRVERG